MIKLKTMAWLCAAVLFIAVGVAHAGPPPRLGPPQCTRYTVKRGDTAWKVAQQNHVVWSDFVALNQYIDDLAQIWPLDELTLWCPPPEVPKPVVVAAVIPPPTTAAASPAVAAAIVPIAPPAVEDRPGVDCTAVKDPDGAPAHRWDGSVMCVTSPKVMAAYLRNAGFDGDALVVMLAICLAESSGDPYAHGDRPLNDDKWGDSVGWCQIRTVKAQTDTGGPRDVNALNDPQHQAESAWRISSGGTNFEPWTEFKNGNYKRRLPTAEKAVQ